MYVVMWLLEAVVARKKYFDDPQNRCPRLLPQRCLGNLVVCPMVYRLRRMFPVYVAARSAML